MADKDTLIRRMIGRAEFLEACGEVKTTELLREAARALQEAEASHYVVFADKHNDVTGECDGLYVEPAMVTKLREKAIAYERKRNAEIKAVLKPWWQRRWPSWVWRW